ncbi:hypothetical protein [Paenibacillus terrae]|uniref:Uncharacterized protein n=1 Tax=Paenibacillus terrae TaxID=159743 RepID=A0A0D7WVW7_9BACL|nr:hypothetical protein [Paenibacillus terrae]KJD43295.1 hypothetical protein QD47_23335 [Paenibacillus terrae]
MFEDISKVFSDDSKSKKRTANGAFSRVNGSRRGMVTAYSLMTKAQQKEYAYSEVSSRYNIYEKIIPVEQLKLLPRDIRFRCWSEWQSRFLNEEILKAWAVDSIDELNFFLNEMDLPMLELLEADHYEESEASKEIRGTTESIMVPMNEEESTYLSLSDLVADDAKFFEFKLNGEMETTDIVSELNRAIQSIIGTQRKYIVDVSVIEVI